MSKWITRGITIIIIAVILISLFNRPTAKLIGNFFGMLTNMELISSGEYENVLALNQQLQEELEQKEKDYNELEQNLKDTLDFIKEIEESFNDLVIEKETLNEEYQELLALLEGMDSDEHLGLFDELTEGDEPSLRYNDRVITSFDRIIDVNFKLTERQFLLEEREITMRMFEEQGKKLFSYKSAFALVSDQNLNLQQQVLILTEQRDICYEMHEDILDTSRAWRTTGILIAVAGIVVALIF